jgi:hypothetical protein
VVHAINWQTLNRYMQIEGFAEPADKTVDLKPLQITRGGLTNDPLCYIRNSHTLTDAIKCPP